MLLHEILEVTLHAIVLRVKANPNDFSICFNIPAWKAPYNKMYSRSLWSLQEGVHYNIRGKFYQNGHANGYLTIYLAELSDGMDCKPEYQVLARVRDGDEFGITFSWYQSGCRYYAQDPSELEEMWMDAAFRFTLPPPPGLWDGTFVDRRCRIKGRMNSSIDWTCTSVTASAWPEPLRSTH